MGANRSAIKQCAQEKYFQNFFRQISALSALLAVTPKQRGSDSRIQKAAEQKEPYKRLYEYLKCVISETLSWQLATFEKICFE